MSLTRAKYSVYLLSASSRAVDLLLSLVCVPWEPDPSLEPMGVLQRGETGKPRKQPRREDTGLRALKCLKRFERVIVYILRRTLPGSYPFWMSP